MVEYLFYGLFFLIPLVFYPHTSEVFEFNKIVTLYIFTILIVLFWIVKMIREEKIIFRRTFLDMPLLFFAGSQVIATLTSIDVRTSIFGYYSRFNGGLLSTFCYVLLYWAMVANFDRTKIVKALKIILVSAVIVAIYGILEHFGGSISCIFVTGQFNTLCWVQDVQTRVFATFGQPNWLASYLTLVSPLAWSLAVRNKNRKIASLEKLVWIGVSCILFLAILFTKSRSGLVAFFLADGIFWLGVAAKSWGAEKTKKIGMVFSFIHLGLFFLMVIFGTSWTPPLQEIIRQKFPGSVSQTQTATQVTEDSGEGGTESGAIRAIVWVGAIKMWMAYPIFGTGVETFGLSYWQFRPTAHNDTSEWDYLYNKAHNEYLNYLSTTGIVGLVSYVVLIMGAIYQTAKSGNQKKSVFFLALIASYISILVTNFFGFSVVGVSLLFFLMPGMAVIYDRTK